MTASRAKVACEIQTERREIMRENQRIGMRTDLEVLSSFDLIITTSTSDSEIMRERESENE